MTYSDERTCSVCGVRSTALAGWVAPAEVLQPCAGGYECKRTDWLLLPALPSLQDSVERYLSHDLQLFGILAELSVAPIEPSRLSLKTPNDVVSLLESIDEWATVEDLSIFKYRHWPAAREVELAYGR